MSTAEKKLKASLADYFAYCDSIEGWAEYFDGEIFDMAGGTPEHAMIGSNFVLALGNELKGSSCFVHFMGLRVEADPSRKYVYPDAAVFCGEASFSSFDKNAATNPTVIIEILSPTTSDFDRGGKRIYYMAMPSVQEYILIEQSAPNVEIYIRRSESEWTLRKLSGLDTTLEISSLSVPVTIPLSEIYHRVSFPA